MSFQNYVFRNLDYFPDGEETYVPLRKFFDKFFIHVKTSFLNFYRNVVVSDEL